MRTTLTACLLLLCTSTYAGNITGTVEGTADVSIAPLVGGQYPPSFTTYHAVPSTLTFSYDTAANYFDFAITNDVYSLDTATLVFREPFPRQYAFVTLPPIEAMFLTAYDLHVDSIQADLYSSLVDGSITTAGYDYQQADFRGNGQEVKVTFTPFAVPEPSAMILALSAMLIFVFACVVMHVLNPPRKQS